MTPLHATFLSFELSGRATQGIRLINHENSDKVCYVDKAEES